MVELLSKTIKSKKDGKEYTLYYLQAGEFRSKDFFANSLSISDFCQIATLIQNDGDRK